MFVALSLTLAGLSVDSHTFLTLTMVVAHNRIHRCSLLFLLGTNDNLIVVLYYYVKTTQDGQYENLVLVHSMVSLCLMTFLAAMIVCCLLIIKKSMCLISSHLYGAFDGLFLGKSDITQMLYCALFGSTWDTKFMTICMPLMLYFLAT